MSLKSFLAQVVLRARRTPLVKRFKNWIPQPLRQRAWNLAVAHDEFIVAGSRMRIPAGDRNAYYLSDEYEPEVVAKLQEMLRPGMTYCDVGANMGVLVLLAARLVGPAGRVFAFEPFPANVAVIRENLALNGLNNVTLIPAAVAEQNGEAQLHLSKWCGSHGLAENPAAALGESITVKTTRLDAVPGLDRIDLLKSDTEGTELSVLRSLGGLKPTAVIVEVNTGLFKAMSSPAAECTGPGFLRSLRHLGYRVEANLSDPAAGIAPIESDQEGMWNLLLKPDAA